MCLVNHGFGPFVIEPGLADAIVAMAVDRGRHFDADAAGPIGIVVAALRHGDHVNIGPAGERAGAGEKGRLLGRDFEAGGPPGQTPGSFRHAGPGRVR